MKILVIGDTHRNTDMVRDIWPKLKDIDLVIHTGDNYTDAIKLEQELGVPFAFVRGNCDGSCGSSELNPRGGDFAVIETEFGNILLTHGHNEHVSYDIDRLRYKALENNCICAVFGHTHRAMVLEEDIWYVNPGSLPRPRDGSGGSYAIIRTTTDSFNATVVYYNTVMSASSGGLGIESHGSSSGREVSDTQGKSSRSGFLSELMKYSDRF